MIFNHHQETCYEQSESTKRIKAPAVDLPQNTDKIGEDGKGLSEWLHSEP